MGFCGCIWSVYGCPWVLTSIYGYFWVFMSFYGCLGVSVGLWVFVGVMGIYGSLWVSMNVYGYLWVSMGVMGVMGVMGIYGCLWVSMSACGFLGIFWVVGSGYVWYLSVSYRIYWFNTFCLCWILFFVWLFYLILLRIDFNFWIEIHNLKVFHLL